MHCGMQVMWLCAKMILVSHRGSVMVPLYRVLAISYTLSIVTMSPFAAVWP